MTLQQLWILGTALGTETLSMLLTALIGLLLLLLVIATTRQKRYRRSLSAAWSFVQPFEE
jgi:hypothetical protein